MDGLDVLARLGLAAVCGLAIGLERQLNQHEAGMRTHVLLPSGPPSSRLPVPMASRTSTRRQPSTRPGWRRRWHRGWALSGRAR